jgi:hypothetical protein
MGIAHSALLVVGAFFVGWIAALGEYCQYEEAFRPGECGVYQLVRLACDAAIGSVGTDCQALVIVGMVTIGMLVGTLRIFHRTLTATSIIRVCPLGATRHVIAPS